MQKRGKKLNKQNQLAFDIEKAPEKDRNHNLGGRSFYFFDFDENIAFLDTSILLFHKETGEEFAISGREFALYQKQIGKEGVYKNFKIIPDDRIGSFRNYRDREMPTLARLVGKKQNLIKDIQSILSSKNTSWQGPSWSCFFHAVFNQRPLALITARGHAPETLKEGIRLFVKAGYLPHEPNYLGIYPVNYPAVTKILRPNAAVDVDVSQLKKEAIKHAFAESIKVYGDKPHRFGMSDDDPKNIALITEAMQELKVDNPHISFFVIETSEGQFSKRELGTAAVIKPDQQLELSIESPL